ncbi:PaaX family transcriptional regulator C-terminal domain-containing protein [Ornithinimicrobium pekingense]|uniref:Phenylacetic acid degradation operon negative regulatory protein n=1 Tax=Ornithinimicrobium pekingense TaxID=384677 RepID=A0ABQ2F626_9MICO|nr:PaaX family transcriptional regulator C-terminal domain-containing protein [Ornithinimicrobium pekingense]GGK65642.1 phenylacetic acid degradation operon negative regulatory protein [Ornithinimicrobium pekingense]
MHARSAVVDLYGDHLRERGWWAPVAGLVALASSCQVQPAAARTAVSRLVREGWLVAQRREGVRGYAATPLARERLARAHERIYAARPRPWAGTWHLVVVGGDGDRRRRDRVSASLGYLGYGRLSPGTWASPWRSPELDETLAGHGAAWTGWTATPETDDATALAGRLWDLGALAAAYQQFAATLPEPTSLERLPPHEAYPLRTALVHEWRKFLFRDPGLPVEVLPADWPGQRVREAFLDVAGRLRPGAETFVTSTLRAAPDRPSGAADGRGLACVD